MFKLIFRTITLVMFMVFLSIGLAVWKGGEPFRWIGEGAVSIGETISEFGDFVDDVIAGSREVKNNIDRFKDVVIPEKAAESEKSSDS